MLLTTRQIEAVLLGQVRERGLVLVHRGGTSERAGERCQTSEMGRFGCQLFLEHNEAEQSGQGEGSSSAGH